MRTKTIVLVHGLWENNEIWVSWVPSMTAYGFKIEYASIEEAKTFAEAVQIVRSAVKKHQDCIVIGHSIGGLVARKVASEVDNIGNLILISPPPANPLQLPFKTSVRALKPQYLFRLIFKWFRFKPAPADMIAMFGEELLPVMSAKNYSWLILAALLPQKIGLSKARRNFVMSCYGDPSCGPRTQKEIAGQGFVHIVVKGSSHYPMLSEDLMTENMMIVIAWMLQDEEESSTLWQIIKNQGVEWLV